MSTYIFTSHSVCGAKIDPFSCDLKVERIVGGFSLRVDNFSANNKKVMRCDYMIVFSVVFDDGAWGRWVSNANKLKYGKKFEIKGTYTMCFDDVEIKVIVHGKPVLGENVAEYKDMDSLEKHCDVKFNCNDCITVKSHKVLLSRISPVFKSMFTSQFANTDVIDLPDTDSETFEALNRYAITGNINVVSPTDYKLVIICNKYLITSIINRWANIVLRNINTDTAVDVMRVALEVNCMSVAKQASEYIKTHALDFNLNDLDKEELILLLKS